MFVLLTQIDKGSCGEVLDQQILQLSLNSSSLCERCGQHVCTFATQVSQYVNISQVLIKTFTGKIFSPLCLCS